MGNIERPGSADLYRFTGANGDKLSFDSETSCCNFRLRLVAPNGAVIWNDIAMDDTWIALTQNGQYQLTVSKAANPGIGTYGFALLRL